MARKGQGRRSGGGGNLAANWNKARETTGSETPLDDPVPVNPGTYTMQLLSGEIVDAGDHRQVMFKWGVLDEGDSEAVICTEWERIDDADRLVWLQRKFAALGVDLEECEIKTENDLSSLIVELVSDGCCAKVRVIEKDGYVNMRTRKFVEVEESGLFDPNELLKRGASSGAATSTKKEEDQPSDAAPAGKFEEYDYKEGERVQFTLGDGWIEGEILSFTDDDEARIRVEGSKRAKTISLANCEPLNPEGDSGSDSSTDDSSTSTGSEPFKRSDFAVGDRVLVDFAKDGQLEAEVTSVPPKGEDIQITPDDTKEPELVKASDVVTILPKPDSGSRQRRSVDSSSSKSASSDDEWSEGDECRFMDGKKQHEGQVRSVDGKVAKVKVQGIRKQFSVPVSELEDPK